MGQWPAESRYKASSEGHLPFGLPCPARACMAVTAYCYATQGRLRVMWQAFRLSLAEREGSTDKVGTVGRDWEGIVTRMEGKDSEDETKQEKEREEH